VKGRTLHMPAKNTIKEYDEKQYYHVYNRGVEKREIFLDDQDYTVFIGLIKKYLTGENPNKSTNRHKFKHLGDDVKLLSYCLMPNHFHLLLYQESEKGISQFMRKLATGYVMYFNNRYNRVGGLFQGRFKASLINSDPYLYHISRYIHLNPKEYSDYPYSSLKYYSRPESSPVWLTTDKVLELFDNSSEQYLSFVDDYVLSDTEIRNIESITAN
jgi:putative transposase